MKLSPFISGSVIIAIGHLCVAAALAKPKAEDEAKVEDRRTTKELVEAADAILAKAAGDPVNMGKKAGDVFTAAKALMDEGELDKADEYFQKGLQLSPWSLDEQMKRARVLIKLKREPEAKEIAQMIWSRSESDALCDEAAGILGKPKVQRPAAPPESGVEGPWICFVPIGPVDWLPLSDLMSRLHTTLGLPVYCSDSGLGVGNHDRSALDRWVRKDIMPHVNWASPPAARLLEEEGVTRQEDLKSEALLAFLDTGLRLGGRTEEADDLALNAGWHRMWDKQWNASALLHQLNAAWYPKKGGLIIPPANVPGHDNAIVLGITSCDIYDGDVNYLFGSALTNGRMGVTSFARFRAEMSHEPPDRKRLVARAFRQCLSSIGFSLGVPRPTDPTSARAYPASVPEQDAKSEYMSEACIKGFERALGVQLPAAAHRPVDAR